MNAPIRRGTAQRLGLRIPERTVYADIEPNMDAFMAGIKRLNEALRASGFAFGVGKFGGAP